MSDDRSEVLRKEFLQQNNYNMPLNCAGCGGVMVFKGVGEYVCEKCGSLEYDDYGKVRTYLESHGTATSAEVSAATGVTQKSIREMLRESRIEISSDSRTFLRCDLCGVSIRSGRFCPKCEINYHRMVEEQVRSGKAKDFAGFSLEPLAGEDGSKRFTRRR